MLALKFNVIAAKRVENEKKTAESSFAVAKADVLKAEMKGLSMSESAKLVKMAIEDAKAGSFTGTVKFYNEKKGFGFIKMDGSGKEIIVHSSGLIDAINENDKVTFDIKEVKKVPYAVNLRLN
jgi:CspA family cold shock protein